MFRYNNASNQVSEQNSCRSSPAGYGVDKTFNDRAFRNFDLHLLWAAVVLFLTSARCELLGTIVSELPPRSFEMLLLGCSASPR